MEKEAMKSTKVVVVAAASAVGITLAVSGLQAMQTPSPRGESVSATDFIHFGSRGGWGRGGEGRAFERICGEERDERLTQMVAFIESFVDFTPEQIGAWQGLVGALRNGSDTIGQSCTTLAPLPEDASATERLAQVELVASTGLDILRQVRPAFDDLYAVLDDDQKAALDGLINRRRR
jgi:hypothetical protein